MKGITYMPKVFISHSWEDNEISRKLAENLMRDGAEVWIDYTKIEGGDSLPKVISNAIDWCDTLILIWSGSATGSYWVEEEWTCAHSLRKRIIPCVVDHTELPSILRSKLYINFENFELGYISLARTLKIRIKDSEEKHKTPSEPETKKPEKKAEPVTPAKKKPFIPKKKWYKPVGITFAIVCLVIIGITQFDVFNNADNEKLADNIPQEVVSDTTAKMDIQKSAPSDESNQKIEPGEIKKKVTPEKEDDSKREQKKSSPQTPVLRSQPKELAVDDVRNMLKDKHLFDSYRNKSSKGF
ncbi:MAG: TIR domain-containing protein, partial [Candidatus Lokiarchaeota archaeon]|nr:TIR domain-containing protein [Candidatus Lokiarchaeota archaeon]